MSLTGSHKEQAAGESARLAQAARAHAEQTVSEYEKLLTTPASTFRETVARWEAMERVDERVHSALNAELVAWTQAHGSDVLRDLVSNTPISKPIDLRNRYTTSKDELETLARRLETEFLAKTHPDWYAYQPPTEQEPDGSTVDASRMPLEVVSTEHRAFAPEANTTPVVELLDTARQCESRAVLAMRRDFEAGYSNAEERACPGSGAYDRDVYYCATSELRMPGHRFPTQIVLDENVQQRVALDRIAKVFYGPERDRAAYAQQLARVAEIECGRPQRALDSDAPLRATLVRIDNGLDGRRRAIVSSDRGAHVLQLDGVQFEAPADKQLVLQRDGQHVLVRSHGGASRVLEDKAGTEQTARPSALASAARALPLDRADFHGRETTKRSGPSREDSAAPAESASHATVASRIPNASFRSAPDGPESVRNEYVRRAVQAYGVPAGSLPESGRVHGRLVGVEPMAAGVGRAVVVSDGRLYVVRASTKALEQRRGCQVSLERSGARVLIKTARTRERGLGR